MQQVLQQRGGSRKIEQHTPVMDKGKGKYISPQQKNVILKKEKEETNIWKRGRIKGLRLKSIFQ